MAIAHDSTTAAGNNKTGTAASWSHTVASGGVLFVVVMMRNATDANRSVSSVTYDGVNLTQAIRVTNDTYDLSAEIWYLANPTTGSSKTITVTLAGAGNLWSAAGSSFTGVNTTNPIGATQTAQASSTGISLSITPSYSNSWIIDSVYSKSDNAITAGQTERSQQTVNSSGDRVASQTAGPVSTATTMGWTWSASGQNAVQCAVEIRVATAPVGNPWHAYAQQ